MSPGVLILIAALGIALLLLLVIKFRLQAFLALLIASLFVAIAGGIPLNEVAKTIQDGMGSTLGFIAIVVGIGTMLGEMLRISGGAEQLAQTLVGRFGVERAPWALGLTGFIVSIPVFFDVGLITIAIASGATVISHVNDSGFWLISRYLGISEKNTLRSWTVMETIIGVVGFLVVLAISFFV